MLHAAKAAIWKQTCHYGRVTNRLFVCCGTGYMKTSTVAFWCGWPDSNHSLSTLWKLQRRSHTHSLFTGWISLLCLCVLPSLCVTSLTRLPSVLMRYGKWCDRAAQVPQTPQPPQELLPSSESIQWPEEHPAPQPTQAQSWWVGMDTTDVSFKFISINIRYEKDKQTNISCKMSPNIIINLFS